MHKMNSENSISYKGIPIKTTQNLRKSTTSRFSVTNVTNQYLLRILQFECILYQGNINDFERRYSLNDMLRVQSYLENLDLLEFIKYSDYSINARKLLHKYLHSQYNFSVCDLLTQIPSLTIKEKFIATDNIISNNIPLIFDDEKNQPSPSKSVRHYLNQYLSLQMDAVSKMRYGLYCPTTKTGQVDQIANTSFFLPAYKVPDFLLAFTFADGRNFEHTVSQINPKKMPPFNKTRSCSEYSYQIVLNKINDFMTQTKIISPYKKSALFRFDNIFSFYRLNALSYYYQLYLSDPFLDLMLRHYNFTYRQVIELEATIINQIFKDEEFIIAGLKSNYIDFMLPFDIVFQYTVHNPIPDTIPKDPKQFEKDLKKIKHEMMKIWKNEVSLQCAFSFSKKGDFSISANEKIFTTCLKRNSFYNIFYVNPAKFFSNFTLEKNVHFLCFDTIKKAIQ